MILSNRAVRKLVSDVQSFCKEEIHLFLYLVAHHISKKKKKKREVFFLLLFETELRRMVI